MITRIRSVLSTLFALAVFGSSVFLLFLLGRALVRVFVSLRSDIAVAIVAAGATVLVAVLSVVLQKFFETRSLVQREHREKKIPVYEDLIKFIFRVLMGGKIGKPVPEDEIIEFMADFTQRAMVWASDEVLAAWVKWRRLLTNEALMKVNPIGAMFVYEELILAIRRDLGHKNKRLSQGDVLSLFLNDIDKYIPPKPR